jgi:hypothetical protein
LTLTALVSDASFAHPARASRSTPPFARPTANQGSRRGVRFLAGLRSCERRAPGSARALAAVRRSTRRWNVQLFGTSLLSSSPCPHRSMPRASRSGLRWRSCFTASPGGERAPPPPLSGAPRHESPFGRARRSRGRARRTRDGRGRASIAELGARADPPAELLPGEPDGRAPRVEGWKHYDDKESRRRASRRARLPTASGRCWRFSTRVGRFVRRGRVAGNSGPRGCGRVRGQRKDEAVSTCTAARSMAPTSCFISSSRTAETAHVASRFENPS